MSVDSGALTQRLVHPTAPVLLTKSGPLGTHHPLSELRSSNERPIVGNNQVAPGATSYGLASYYEEGTQTASGENFDPQALTAAHPDLPFGTKLRVTNVTTGKSVIVRVNDRGPFVPGRIVDVSHSAAAALGIIEQGTAKVKVDVVQ